MPNTCSACIAQTVDKDLPAELAFLEHRDAFHRRATQVVDMGERTIDLLLRFLEQGHGRLSKRAVTNEFKDLTATENECSAGYLCRALLVRLSPSRS